MAVPSERRRWLCGPWRGCAIALLSVLMAGCGGGETQSPSGGPLKIGLLMPEPPTEEAKASGAHAFAVDIVNRAGGVAGGRPLELVDHYYSQENFEEVAAAAFADEELVATIGPGKSSQLMQIAQDYVDASRVIVSPTSTADEVLRAFGGGGFVWRTKQSDIGQSELFANYAKRVHAKKLALLTTLGVDGATFFRWFGFFATEYGYAASDVHVGELEAGVSCDETVKAALESAPDVLFVASAEPDHNECVIHGWAKYRVAHPKRNPRLVFADVGIDYTQFRNEAGTDAEEIEGFSTVGQDGADFDVAYRQWSGRTSAGPNGNTSFDAVLLLAYGLEASEGQGGQALDDALRRVVDARGAPAGHDEAGIAAALAAIDAGDGPDVSGTSGDLDFTSGLYTDPATSYWGRWAFERGALVRKETYFTGAAGFLTASKALAAPSESSLVEPDTEPGYTPSAKKTDAWALIVSFSSGWDNYRHQADGLRQFQALLTLGIPRDHIILIGADDLAQAPQNKAPGTVRNTAGGPNLYTDVEYDYLLENVNAGDILSILKGEVTDDTPKVLESTSGSSVYVFFSGHGGKKGIPVGASSVSEGLSGGTKSTVSPASLRAALCEMQDAERYRRVLVAVEACYSGVFGSVFDGGIELGCNSDGTTPGDPLLGVLMMTAANTVESSYAAQYDGSLASWTANQFAFELAAGVYDGTGADQPAYDFFASIARAVEGAHVSLYNEGAFGDPNADTLKEFFGP